MPMTQDLATSLENFSSQLEEAKNGASDREIRALCEAQDRVSHILELISSPEASSDSIVSEFGILERYVSDSLPWREEILDRWSQVCRSWARV